MANCVCDDVRLWGVKSENEVIGECWVCKFLVPQLSPRQVRYSNRQNRINRNENPGSNESCTSSETWVGVLPKADISSPGFIRERQRLEKYWRESERLNAQRSIKVSIQNKRHDDFASLREALYQVYQYRGPFLQRPGDKNKAVQYLRQNGFGAMFVRIVEHEVKWKWLHDRVSMADNSHIFNPDVRM
ncbi:uncharacterized protein MELLADRAFT_73539 [Melampsora larici-populina 98AG31]|uniref:Uncharacterized protein n=1 Tax=Melampsora larici-populina (strain 98AG31 / pathotype 3-4-7) TaxID=747676 RepID=F4S9F8_MELLP|nr:uncharacterized protein MELLADRAFT_73539 [Melampsora larici-populina 98AG31]EGF98714.1 hypothetical protein MELLADRAFT_73539 [Melampsora larici-populina 98AG31]